MTDGTRTYTAYNQWQAAYLLAMGVPLVEAFVTPEGHVNYCFDNEDDRAWTLGRAFYHRDACIVDAVAYKDAYQQAAKARDAARVRGASNGYEHRTA